jgi:DNA repair protein RadC
MKPQNLAIPMWAEDDKPREKFMLKGRTALSDAELIAILIGTGTGNKTAVDLARECLQLTQGDLNAFGKLRLAQLCDVKGIGPSKAISILAALELGRRRRESEAPKRKRITSSQEAFELLQPYFLDLQHEEFYTIYLNRANEVLATDRLSVGGTSGTFVDAKILFKKGMDCAASGIILAHNHPSGQKRPSGNDEALTKKLVQFGQLIEMPVLDHLILTDNGYFSFADQQLL